jgi:glycosyltransferase involved in cell wall biosynthesis
MSVPRVSVVMTLYNKGAFVEEAILSVLHGTYADFELLVIDDASTDDGPARVNTIADPRVRLITAERNQGRAAAANRGYKLASGEYIAILDADDLAEPERLAMQVAFMDAHPEVGVSGTAAQCFGASDERLSWPSGDGACRARLLFTDPVLYGSAIFRSALLQQGDSPARSDWSLPGEDYLMMIELSRRTRFGNLELPLLRYRIGAQNQRHGRDVVHDRGALCKEVFRFFGIPLSDAEVERQLLYHQVVAKPLDQAFVSRFMVWHEELKSRVSRVAEVPFDGFLAESDRRFRKVFFMVADRDLACALLMLRARKELRGWAAYRYLITVTYRRWFQ